MFFKPDFEYYPSLSKDQLVSLLKERDIEAMRLAREIGHQRALMQLILKTMRIALIESNLSLTSTTVIIGVKNIGQASMSLQDFTDRLDAGLQPYKQVIV